MVDTFREFSTSLSGSYPLLWALFVMAVVAVISLALFFFWELLFRLLPAVSPLRKSRRGR